jgi:hypothetical protein
MYVVVPLFSTAADEGEALSTTARPAKLCSPLGRTADMLAEAFVQEFVGNPRKVDRLLALILGEKFFILYAQSVLVRATLRTRVESLSAQTRRDWTTKSCGLLDGIPVDLVWLNDGN